MTSALAGVSDPAAVVIIGISRGMCAGAEEHRLVTGHRGLRRQDVHRLRARDARHPLERQRRDLARGELRQDHLSLRRARG